MSLKYIEEHWDELEKEFIKGAYNLSAVYVENDEGIDELPIHLNVGSIVRIPKFEKIIYLSPKGLKEVYYH